jgi:peptidoglycan L-alanyl-D-glutamate endopeptidase CwlK
VKRGDSNMPTDLIRISLDQLYLPFVEILLDVMAACRARGADYFAISGYRSDAEQMVLWCQGRTTPGTIVTGARAGESAHNYGIAVDFCRDGVLDRRGLQPDYRPESYVILGEEARRAGLVWGGDFKHLPDRPHVQWPGFVTKEDLAPLLQVKAKGGLSAVFAHLDGLKEAA